MLLDNDEHIKKIYEEIDRIDQNPDETEKNVKQTQLFQAVDTIMDLAQHAYNSGILSLEKTIMKLEDNPPNQFLKELLLMLIDGEEEKKVKDFGLIRYHIVNPTDYEALIYLIYYEGVLFIKSEKSSLRLMADLIAYLPKDMEIRYRQENECTEKAGYDASERKCLLDKLCTRKNAKIDDPSDFLVVELVNYIVCNMCEGDLQILLEKIYSYIFNCLIFYIFVLKEQAQRRVFANLPQPLADNVLGCLFYCGPVRMIDVMKDTNSFLKEIIRLVREGKFADKYNYLIPLYGIVDARNENETEVDPWRKEILELMDEYESSYL